MEREEMIADGMAKVEEGERFLSVSRSTLYTLMDAGELPYCKIGRARRIPWRALKDYAAATLRMGKEGQP